MGEEREGSAVTRAIVDPVAAVTGRLPVLRSGVAIALTAGIVSILVRWYFVTHASGVGKSRWEQVAPTRNSPFMVNPMMKAIEAVAYISNDVLALLTLAGVIIVVRQRAPSAPMLTFAVTVLWVTAVYGVLQLDARYSIPFRTAEIALACVAVGTAGVYLRRRAHGNTMSLP